MNAEMCIVILRVWPVAQVELFFLLFTVSKIVVSNLIGDCEVAVPFLFDVDTVVRGRMYGGQPSN